MRMGQTIYIKDSFRFILFLSIIVFIVYFIFMSFARHDNFYSRRLDLGNMDQTVWNVLHGNGFMLTSASDTLQISRLASHADFLLIFLAPLYLLWSSPKMLLIVQTIILGLGALPVYWIAQNIIKSKKIALLFSLAYLLYPPLERVALHDFHSVVLSTTFLLFAYWYMQKNRYYLFALFAFLAAIGKEDVWLVTGLMGCWILATKKNKFVGVTTALISFVMFYVLFWKIIPAASPTKQHFALAYLSEFGGDLNTMLKNIFTNPFAIIRDLFSADRFWYFFQLFLPLGFLPLFAPLTLVFAAPTILINTLSNNTLMRMIDYQYNSLIIPFIFIAAMQGFTVLRSVLSIKRISLWFTCMTIASVFTWGELPIGLTSRFLFFLTPQPEKETMKQVEKSIGQQYTVSATNNIGAHFSERQFLYNFPVAYDVVDFTIVELGDPYAWPSGDEQKKSVDSLLNNPNYTLIAQKDRFYAFKKTIQ